MSNQFYDQLDVLVSKMIERLNGSDSDVKGFLALLFSQAFETLFYGNLIHNFFRNLNPDYLQECGLSSEYVTIIKSKYENIQKDVKSALFETFGAPLIDKDFYDSFKAAVKKDFPPAYKIIADIEREVNIDKARKYLEDKRKEIEKTWESEATFSSILAAGALIAYVQQNKRLPSTEDLHEPFNNLVEALPEISKPMAKRLMEGAKEMLAAEREYQEGFEARLYKRWEEPLDLLECLIGLSMVYGQSHRDKLAKLLNETNSAKFAALVKIHQRALQVSNEILVLLKAGYADGANARWRTLCELGVISFFLRDSDNQVSQRYLDHQAVRRYKDAIAYQAYCEELGEQPFEKEEFEKIEKEKENVCSKYADGFADRDWDWIPTSILQNQWFKALAEHVELGRWLPYYNLASAASHGLSRGFYRLGLPVESQDTPLCRGSNLGLADPLQNTAIFLYDVTACLLTLEADFESLLEPYVMDSFVKDIGEKAVAVQKAIEQEESSKSN
jgi:hypothetical protein